MALRVWLPLNGSLENKGLSDTDFGTSTAFASTGKTGAQSAYSNMQKTITCSKLTGITEFSLAYWLKVDSSIAITNWGDIIGLECTVGSNSAIIRDEFTNAVGLHQILVGKDTSIGSNTYNYYGAGISTSTAKDVWAHFAIAKNATNTYVYVNGVLTVTLTNSNFESSPQQLTGKIYLGNTSSTAAQFNDLRIYDHCLSAKEVKEIAQGLVVHYKLDEVIGNNLLSNSFEAAGQSESAYMVKAYNLTENLVNGDTYTITAKLTASSEKKAWGVWVGGGSYIAGSMWQISKTTDIYTKTFTADANMADKTFIQVYVSNNSGTQGSTAVTGTAHVHWIKIEKGSVSTGWGPSSAEVVPYIPDSSGYEHNGIITGDLIPQTDSSRYLNAIYNVNGTANRITTPTLTMPKDAITLNIWFKSTNTAPTGDYHMLVDSNANRQWYEIAVHKTGYFRGGIFVNGTRYAANCSTTTLLNGNWHMLTLTYDGTAVKRYTDGVLESTSTVAISSGLSTPTALTLFRDGPNATYACQQASLSDFRVYATALSAEDIADLYHTSANIDNLNGLHGFEFIEDGEKDSIYKNGIISNDKNINYLVNNFAKTNTITDWTFGGTSPSITNGIVTLTGTAPSVTSKTFTVNADDILVIEIGVQLIKTSTTSGAGIYLGTKYGQNTSTFSYNFTTKKWTISSSSNTNPYFVAGYNSTDYYHCKTYLLGSNKTIDDIPEPEATNTRGLYAIKLNSDTTTNIRSGYNNNTEMIIKLSDFKIYNLNEHGIVQFNNVAKTGYGYLQYNNFIEK